MNKEFSQLTQENTEKENLSRKKKEKGFLRELIEFAIIAFVIVIPFRMYVAQPFVVNGASMDPTFENGEYLIVDQLTYHFEKPRRGSILIFKYPNDTSKYFIKRVIGLPGETVIGKEGAITIINKDHPEGVTLEEPYVKLEKRDSFEAKLGNREYFVMGDNRLGSADSRMWGALPEEDVVGRPIIRLFPLSRINILPGNFELSSEEI